MGHALHCTLFPFRLARVSGISKSVMKQCSRHLSDCIKGDEPAQAHFRAVCRALVSEATELSTFLEKVSQFDEERGEELRELDMQDWVSNYNDKYVQRFSQCFVTVVHCSIVRLQ